MPLLPINKGFDTVPIKKKLKCLAKPVIFLYFCNPHMEGVAQLVRASVCGTEGRGFETPRSPMKTYRFCLSVFFKSLFMHIGWFLIPLISAFIGWFTNWIAIKMLFHPREPRKILGFTLQGIFPKRQQQFAEKLGKLVSDELLSFSDIATKITDPTNLQSVMPMVDTHIDDFLRKQLPEQMPIISMFIGDSTIRELKSVFLVKLQELFPEIMHSYMHTLQDQLNLEAIVTEKVAGFSSDKMEQILMSIMQKEFRFVEIIGGVLGFAIGLLQVLITYLQ